MKQNLLNQGNMMNSIMEIFNESEILQEHPEYDELAEEEALRLSFRFVDDMEKYAHQSSRSIYGNLNNIEHDFEFEHKGENFDKVLSKADNGELTELELTKLQDWCQGWFFETFGTFGIKYNFESYLCELIYKDELELAS